MNRAGTAKSGPMSRLSLSDAVEAESRPNVFILEIFPDDLFHGQALNVLALPKIEAEVAREVGIVGEALEIGLSARLAGLIRDRDCYRRNSDVSARLGRNQNIVTAIDPGRAAFLLRYRYMLIRRLLD